MTDGYDAGNPFARILRGDIAREKIHEDAFAVAFRDASPLAPVHALVIPRGAYTDLHHFLGAAAAEEIAGFWAAVKKVTDILDLGPSGFNIFSNIGHAHGQEVFHFHLHIVSGRPMHEIFQLDLDRRHKKAAAT